MFQDKNAAHGGAAQKLFQLSKILSPELSRKVMSFSGAEQGAKKAVSWLNLKFNSHQFMIPKVYQEIKDIFPARHASEVPRTAKQVLRKVESLLALMKCDETNLPADVTQAIFRCLYLLTEEKKHILHYLEADVGVTVTVIRQYIINIFCEYETMANALGPPIKPKHKPELPRLPPVDITADAAITGEGKGAGGRGGRAGRGGRNGRGGRQGKNK